MSYQQRLCALLTCYLLLASCSTNSNYTEITRPNILFIMSDDHAEQAIGCYGHGLNETPNIDRIADAGVIFTNSFVANSICAPSRAVLLTGKFSHINGQTNNSKRFDGTQQTFPKLLQSAGYQTALVGKWHLKSDPTGFDFWSIHYDQGDYYNPDFNEMGEKKRYEGYSPDIVCLNGLKWLDQRDKTKPFALLLHFKAPHRNWMPDTSKFNMYENYNFSIPETFWDNYSNKGSAARDQKMSIQNDMDLAWDLKLRGKGVAKRNSGFQSKLDRMNPEQRNVWDGFYDKIKEKYVEDSLSGKNLAIWKYQRYIKDYLKVVSSVDDNVGLVLAYLEEMGLDENTIVIYTSDQGFYLGEHGWFDKRFMYEESLRTPLLMCYPKKIEAGGEIHSMVQNIDYAPTFLDYAGIEVPGDMQGESLRPLLEGTKDKVRDAILYQYFEYPGAHNVKRHYGIRTERYKLIHFYYDIDEWELYDLENDPNEMKNLIKNEEARNVIDSLKTKLNRLQAYYNYTDSRNQSILREDMEARKTKFESLNK